MRESVPHLLHPRLLRLCSKLSVLALTVLGVSSSGCSGKTKGQIILALQTDMSLPEDVTRVKIEVKADGASRHDQTYIVDPNVDDASKIPSTLSIVAGEKESETIELKIIALRPGNDGLEPRTLNKTVTTMPKERIALLRVPMQWLCTGTVSEVDDGEYESDCEPEDGKDMSCVAGACKDTRVNSTSLPDWAADLVFGGSDDASDGTCFPTEECFDAGLDLMPDMTDCTVLYDPPNDDVVNFAVVAAYDALADTCLGGIKSGQSCYVGLDSNRDFGWYEADEGGSSGERRYQLPQGVCERIADGRATRVRASSDAACLVTKTPSYPTCGPWSSVPKPGDGPPTAVDADGDSFGRAVDCDDTDPSVFPGAPERCDELDNNCDDMVDNECATDLPFSHHVDFSATDGFTSTSDYAIYQRFDGTTPLDLDQRTVTYEPSADFTRYTVTTGNLEWDDDLGALVPVLPTTRDVSNCDDCYTSVELAFPFNFFGTEHHTVYPSSNGYLTFGMGDTTYTESVEYFLAGYPRIAALFSDLDTTGPTIQDEVYYSMTSSKLVVTYNNIQLFPQSGTQNTFQFVLFSDGVIKVSYNGMDDLDESSIAGITPGSIVSCTAPLTDCSGSCVDLETDLGNCGSCGNQCTSSSCTAGECTGEKACIHVNVPCEGVCSGSCVRTVTREACEGMCQGSCTGTCDFTDGAGGCLGACDGDCTGTCHVDSTGPCPDSCSGTCYIDTAMTCAEPAGTPSGPCTFSGQIDSATDCSDTAQAIDSTAGTTYGWTLGCYGSQCECCKHSTDGMQSSQVCGFIDVLSEDACATEGSLRNALMDECMTTSTCGAGCPATPPAAGTACNETEITYCYYPSTMGNCFCMGGEFICQ